MSVEELESAVARLTPEELDRFSEWFQEFAANQWDRQIEADAGERADADFKAGRCTVL